MTYIDIQNILTNIFMDDRQYYWLPLHVKKNIYRDSYNTLHLMRCSNQSNTNFSFLLNIKGIIN